MASIRIEIPAHDSRLEAMASPTKLVNLTPTPDRSPESIAKKITEREATNKSVSRARLAPSHHACAPHSRMHAHACSHSTSPS